MRVGCLGIFIGISGQHLAKPLLYSNLPAPSAHTPITLKTGMISIYLCQDLVPWKIIFNPGIKSYFTKNCNDNYNNDDSRYYYQPRFDPEGPLG